MGKKFTPSQYDYARSALANGIVSGLGIEEIWEAICLAESGEQLDAALTASIRLSEILDEATEKKFKDKK